VVWREDGTAYRLPPGTLPPELENGHGPSSEHAVESTPALPTTAPPPRPGVIEDPRAYLTAAIEACDVLAGQAAFLRGWLEAADVDLDVDGVHSDLWRSLPAAVPVDLAHAIAAMQVATAELTGWRSTAATADAVARDGGRLEVGRQARRGRAWSCVECHRTGGRRCADCGIVVCVDHHVWVAGRGVCPTCADDHAAMWGTE
jgi:hypothetical protein